MAGSQNLSEFGIRPGRRKVITKANLFAQPNHRRIGLVLK